MLRGDDLPLAALGTFVKSLSALGAYAVEDNNASLGEIAIYTLNHGDELPAMPPDKNGIGARIFC